jgi:sugar fermentation stimulation protein A
MLKWPPLLQGNLIRRYKRFKADVKLRNGHIVTAFCPNTGSMMSCCESGRSVYLSRQNRPNRKLKYTWEMIDMPGSLVGVNTGVPNRLVKESIILGLVPGLDNFDLIRSEVKYGINSRIDIQLEKNDIKYFIEVKNCTLVDNNICYFPDAVTSRGLKHLEELKMEVRAGNRACMFYLVQRMDAKEFRPANHIDPAYGKELKKAIKNGVEIMVYDVILDLEGIKLNKPLPYVI